MLISSGVSNTCLFAPAPYYKLNKGFFLGFLFKPLGGLRPPCGLNKKASENVSFIYYLDFSTERRSDRKINVFEDKENSGCFYAGCECIST